ncbi:uncharacterized protein [Rhodnius prolixus]|uniref:uncharacterized protein n=1 Tax=Rhodnius prolixus TaxID=13249 RepID=UPI003D18CF8F
MYLFATIAAALSAYPIVCGLPIEVTNTSDAAPCTVLGITYLHSQQINRDDPCDFCLCLDGEVFCWWQQQCMNSTQHQQQHQQLQENSTVESEEWDGPEDIGGGGTASSATSSSATSSTSATFLQSNSTTETSATPTQTTCRVMGIEYKVGEILPRETGTCLQCQCDTGARVTCSPKDCTSPEQFHSLEQQSLDMFDVDVF